MSAQSAQLKDFDITKITLEDCNSRLECKIDLPSENNPCTIKKSKNDTGSDINGKFSLNSDLYTNFKYKGQVYVPQSCYFTFDNNLTPLPSELVTTPPPPLSSPLPELITNVHGDGIIGQIVIKFIKPSNSNDILNLIIPIYSGKANNNVGEYLLKSIAKLSDSGNLKSNLKLNNLIPKKTEFYHLSTQDTENKKYNTIIFSSSKIIVEIQTYILIWWDGNWSAGDSEKLKKAGQVGWADGPGDNAIMSSSDYTSDLKESTTTEFTENPIDPLPSDQPEYYPKGSINKKGIVSSLSGTSIINCAPVDDNGMLLTDREKGLGNEGITKTTSMDSLTRKYTQGTMAQMLIGAVLLFFLTKLVKSTLTMLNKK